MKLRYRASQNIEAQSLNDLLHAAGVPCMLRNESTALFGDGIMSSEGMPEIWVEDEVFERALEVKRDWIEQGKD